MFRPRFVALLLVLVTLAAYLPVVGDGFSCYDDDVYITNNPIVQNGVTWAGIKWAFSTGHGANWHPVTWLSHMLDCELFGLNAGAQHYINVLIHAANAAALLLLLFRLTDALWPSAFVAALFAWHPLHVESVAWISERKDVLSTIFEILPLLAYTMYARSKPHGASPLTHAEKSTSNPARTSSRGLLCFWLAVLCFALGLMAKPMLVTMPFVMLLLDYWPLKRLSGYESGSKSALTFGLPLSGLIRLVAEKWPFFFLSIASCIVTVVAQQHGGAVISLAKSPLAYRLENIPVAYVSYLLKIIWPAHLAVVYPIHSASWPIVAAAVAVLIAISWLALQMRRQQPYGLVGWLWFLGTLVPVIGLVQVGDAAVANRYTYFPSVGIFLLVAFGLQELAKRLCIPKKLTAGIAGFLLLACLALMENQLHYWRNDVALFSHAIAVTKNNYVAYLNLGYALEKQGDKAGAMTAFRHSLRINPDHAEPHNNLANLLDESGHSKEALDEYRIALRINPHYVAAHENLGTALLKLGQFDEAMKQYAEAARLDPNDWHAPFAMGQALLQQGKDAEAIPYLQSALKIDPNNLEVLTLLAQVLASDDKPNVRDGHTAFRLASRANALTDGAQPLTLDLLAMACAEIGRFDDAVKAEQDALDIAKSYRMTNDIAILQQRLRLYQAHKPLRRSFANTNLKEPRKE